VSAAPDPHPMSASGPTAPAPRGRSRRRASFGLALVAAGVVGLLAVWLLAPSLQIRSNRMVGWQLQGFPGRASDTAATATTFDVYVAQWPTEYKQGDDSWLDQRVIETPMTVTLALQTTDAYEALPWQNRRWFDTGGWVKVHLLAPLGDRVLFDGSGFPPQPRW